MFFSNRENILLVNQLEIELMGKLCRHLIIGYFYQTRVDHRSCTFTNVH